MNKSNQIPQLEQVLTTVARSRRRRQELELAKLELEELILKLESDNRQRRSQQLKNALEIL
jgi:hypothetical protein